MLNHLKLGTKFTLFLSLVLLVGIFLSGGALSNILQQNAEEEIVSQALMLMGTMNSVRNYTSQRIQPLFQDKLDTQLEFIPETVPAFSAQKVFDFFRQNPQYSNYFYKEATINPTNLEDKADNFEKKITEHFRQEQNSKQQSGFRYLSGENKFYIARPIIIKQASCLRCHGKPEVAPKSHVATYGTKYGYAWELGEIIGSQIIYVPAEKIFTQAQKNLTLMMAIFIGIFCAIILLINYLVKYNVIQPILPMAELAQRLANEGSNSKENQIYKEEKLDRISQRGDELGYLGRLLQNMAKEVQAREEALKQQLKTLLTFEIDRSKTDEQVSEITETDYFKSLEKNAENFRRKKNSKD